MANLKEFVLVKKVLHSCCIPYEDNLYIYPEIMKSILHEMKMSMRLFNLTKAWGNNQNIKKSMKVQDGLENPDVDKIQTEQHTYLSKFYHLNLINLFEAVEASKDKNALTDSASIFRGIREIVEKAKRDTIRELKEEDDLPRMDTLSMKNKISSRPMKFETRINKGSL
eukprot:CAMPEP_0205818256 /NCGR_PEP_ID=MMETSP0205-20121125/25559_1 /ASSEMBLY_ACC=CAM_ASM_000278 /TAXON_ID=36767 /ORGANISM="Euplotes focardii, Strain TN1" /LENGTH=167 /DNA_ID=CAMNT_0053110451 /DNA_START=1 /DNA_END=500 /DNA_ORIENTATION=-